MNDLIYLDGFATMPLAPEAEKLMMEVWRFPSNAGSPHMLGERAASYVSVGRGAVADLIGASPSEIYFTSGATESNNLALLGIARWAIQNGSVRRRIIISPIEHRAVLEPAAFLREQGFEIAFAPVTRDGVVDTTEVAKLATDQTLLISVMAANNETGVIQPVKQLASIARAAGALIHCDAAQAAGKMGLNVIELDVDYMSLSAHKLYGPSGVGVLYISAAAPSPSAQIFGGGQQNSIRPGTEPVALIAGFGAAAKVAAENLDDDAARVRDMALRFIQQLSLAGLTPEIVTGNRSVLPGALSVYLPGVDAEDLVVAVSKRVAISTGSACAAGQVTYSHVLRAMHVPEERARSTFRVMINKYLSMNNIIDAAEVIAESARHIRDRTGRLHQS